MKRRYWLIVGLMALLVVSGCEDGDRFDGLKCVDGNGDIYLLKHRMGDTYFIDNLSEIERNKQKTPIEQINERLNKNTGN